MYEAHPVFIQPEDETVKVWKYMDFTKLVSLIDSRRLYFTRADKFNDPFEGSWPRVNVLARHEVPDDVPAENREAFVKAMKGVGRLSKQWPKYSAINCWHMNEHESAAMWKLYLKSDEGIAVQSRYSKLRGCFNDDEKVYLGMVKYLDYDAEGIDAGNLLSSFVHKRKSFEHEREVRALIVKWPTIDQGLDFAQETIADGLKVKIDIERLIETIYVAPSAPDWFAELVAAVVQRYGYRFEVKHSDLDARPLF